MLKALLQLLYMIDHMLLVVPSHSIPTAGGGVVIALYPSWSPDWDWIGRSNKVELVDT